jgi:hypothetical protein
MTNAHIALALAASPVVVKIRSGLLIARAKDAVGRWLRQRSPKVKKFEVAEWRAVLTIESANGEDGLVSAAGLCNRVGEPGVVAEE